MSSVNTQRSELGFVDSFSKLVAVSIGLLYFVGFLVVAGHLSQYGVSGFSVLQLQYLVAGFWSIGPPVGLALVLITARKFEERAAPDIPNKLFNWRRFLMGVSLTQVPYAIYALLLASIPGILQKMTWGLGIRLYLFYLVMINCAQLIWMSWRIPTENETWWKNRRHAVPFYLSLLLMTGLAYVLWFSVRVYPLIPFSLGGGRPLTVAFMASEKKFPDGIKADTSTTNRSIPYGLLVATDKSYVVMSPNQNEKSIEVSRDSVAGIVVLQESRAP
ncbi:MAG TPA: hypothetical protein VKS44_13100 [Candidatus Acidoferrales bacterium]|nr:hypothetical protein [Candidatus Acidoferrales bacterium]